MRFLNLFEVYCSDTEKQPNQGICAFDIFLFYEPLEKEKVTRGKVCRNKEGTEARQPCPASDVRVQ